MASTQRRWLERRPRERPGAPTIRVLVDGTRDLVPVESAHILRHAALSPVRWPNLRRARRHVPEQPWLHRLGHHVAVESGVEGVIAHLLDRSGSVTRLTSQPLWLSYLDVQAGGGPRWRWTCPDFLAVGVDGPVLIECKGGRALQSARTRARLRAVQESARCLGVPYEVHGELPHRVLMTVRAAGRFATPPPGFSRWGPIVLEAAAAAESVTIAELRAAGPSVYTTPAVWHLLWRGSLCPVPSWSVPITNLQHRLRVHDPSACGSTSVPRSSITDSCGPSTLFDLTDAS